jgi:hypothetical protein
VLTVKALRPCLDGGRIVVTVGWDSGHTIRVRTDPGFITLEYTVREEGGRSWRVEDRVYITWTPLHFGGRRPWFRCPSCGRRVGILYSRGGYFRCRTCQRLRYRCKSETPYFRARRRVRKLERRLGDPIWRKPKGMHQTTFARLHGSLQEAQQARDDLFLRSCLPLLRRCGCL